MGSIAKTVVATGATSGLGFEVIKQLLQQSTPYRFILGCRDAGRTESALDQVAYDKQTHTFTLLPLDLAQLAGVKTFAHKVQEALGRDKLDYLFLNAALIKPADEPGINGSQWCESYIVNHLSQHYLISLLRSKLEESRSRIVVVSSGAVRGVKDTSTLDSALKAQSNPDPFAVYPASKFVQLLNAHYWRRQLQGKCDVVAVSPGMIPGTGLGRHFDPSKIPDMSKMPDAKSVGEGAQSLIAALHRNDFPQDPNQIFLTSWGEWWGPEILELSYDKALQDKYSPSVETLEQEEKIA